jgi:hypothetical protein
MKFCQGVMMSCVIIFQIWVILGFSLNMIKISQVLIHFHWYCTIILVHMLKLYVASLTSSSWLNVECKGPWVKKMCSGVKHIFTNEGGCKYGAQWFLNALPLWELHLCRSFKCSKPWLKRKKNTQLGPHDTIENFLKCRSLKFPCIVHLDQKCMSYDE